VLLFLDYFDVAMKGFVLVVGLLFGAASAQVENYTLPSSDPNLIRFSFYAGIVSNGVEIIYENDISLYTSGYNPNNKTRILIDGFLSNSSNSMMTKILRQTFVSVMPEDNTIVVDWGALSGGTSGFTLTSLTTPAALALYPAALPNVQIVGQRVADFIRFLGVDPSNVHIVGHSMGAHIAGVAGGLVKQQQSQPVNRITGLDPAGPLEFYDLPANLTLTPQLNKNDAAWVDAMHTGRGLTSLTGVPFQGTGLGTVATDVGNVDVFVNGGAGQPGCSQTNITNPASILIAACDHYYSWRWWNSSIGQAKMGNTCGTGLLGSCFSGSNQGRAIDVGYSMAPGTTGTYYTKDTNSYQ